MSTHSRLLACVTVLAAVCLGATCEARAVTETVAVEGGPAPGGGNLGLMFGDPWLNESGQVTFGCDLAAPLMGEGIYRYDVPGSGVAIVRPGDPAPGGGTFDMLGLYSQNNAGEVAFMTGMAAGDLFRGDGTLITALALAGDPAPVPPGGTFSMFDTTTAPSLNDLGEIGFQATIMGGTAMAGAFRTDGTTTLAMALEGDPAPAPGGGADGTFSAMFYDVQVNNPGEVAFRADTMGGVSMGGLFRSNGAAVVPIVRAGQAVPFPPGGTFMGMFMDVFFNNAGQVAFEADLTGGLSTRGIFRGDGATITKLAAEGETPPEGGGTFSMFYGLTMNDAGQAAFKALLMGTPHGADDDEGIYRADGVGIDLIVRKGDPVPDGSGTFGLLGMMDLPRINSGGQVAFVADITDPMAVDPQEGIFLADDQEVVQVARTGQALPDGLGTISELGFAGSMGGGLTDRPQPVVNAFGQVVYYAGFDDGMGGLMLGGVFRYTPELHWRAAGGGAWDNNDNWTVGLQPDYVHHVVIDPAVNATVTGPTAYRTIASLQIAPTSGATAVLVLNGSSTLQVASTIAVDDGGTLELRSGMLTTPRMDINAGGTYTGTGGTLDVDLVRQNGGTVNGTLQNQGQFQYTSGTFNGRLLNQGWLILEADFTAGYGMRNEAPLDLWDVTVTLNGSGLDNRDTMYLGEMTLAGNGPLVNNGSIICEDTLVTIGGTGGFTNNGYLTTAAEHYWPGDLTLANTGTNSNHGNIDLATGRRLDLDGADLDNYGTLNVNGARVQGTGTLNNNTGGSVAGRGIISCGFTNSGLVAVGEGTLQIANPFTNNGIVRLADDAANLTGGTIANAGTMEGHGQVASDVDNTGTIDPGGGTLAMSGTVQNLAGGLISATAGNKLLVTSGLASNAGTISLTGGTFDNGGLPLTNNGQVVGYGVLRTGGLANQASVILSGGTATVNGPVTNEATGKIEVAYQPAVFTGDVVNSGEFKVTDTTVTFAGTYTENGVYTSDPADNYFQDVSIGTGGAFVGGAGDRFFVRGDFLSSSSAAGTWNTAEADLIFQRSGDRTHTMGVTGEDRGSGPAAWADNFAWGRVTVQAGETVALDDAGAGGGALYTQALSLEAGATLDMGALNLRLKTAPANDGTVNLATGNLIVDYDGASPAATVAEQIRSGLQDGPTGNWDGPGITSSAAAAHPRGLAAVGVIDNSDSEGGIGGLTEFAGVAVDETSVLAAYTWWGDANLDGVVDSNDYDRIDTNWTLWTREGRLPEGGFRWAVGDFNYDGTIDSNDYDKIDRAWLLSEGGPLAGGGPAPTPEPATLALLALGGMALLARRRRA